MKLRTRLTAVVAIAVAVAVVSVACVSWFATRERLVAEIDTSLAERARRFATLPGRFAGRQRAELLPRVGEGRLTDSDTYFQVIDESGRAVGRTGPVLPVKTVDAEFLATPGSVMLQTVEVDGMQLRMYTLSLPRGGAIQVARDLAEVQATMRGLGIILILTCAVGIAGAAIVGRVIARRSLRPIDDLTGAVEEVARSQALDVPIPITRADDEVGRLAGSFNAMLVALSSSREQQQNLVSDASHELRTPLTSLRTAVELLARGGQMEEPQRRELLDHAVAELDELTHLVGELVELATDSHSEQAAFQDVRLDVLTRELAARVERRTDHAVHVDAVPTLVVGRPALLERAIANLLDNAVKWSPPAAVIRVTVAEGKVSVCDEGPGVPADERERVFERFARGSDVQRVPGSGLGLAIVAKVAAEHGGSAWIEEAPGGGARAVLALPPETMGEYS